MKKRLESIIDRMGNGIDAARSWMEARPRLRQGLRYGALLMLVTLLGLASVAARGQLAAPEPPEDRQVAAAALPAMPAATPAPAPSPEPPRWCWPVEGAILGAYSPEEPVWSESMRQWQTHPALDIAALPGEAVVACGDGTVLDAWKDRLWGNVIVLDHGDGHRSTYANLNTLNLVEVGDRVAMGDVISAAGRSADCESALDWHVHFALEKDGEPVDFEEVMRKEE